MGTYRRVRVALSNAAGASGRGTAGVGRVRGRSRASALAAICALTCALLASSIPAASASTYDTRGEWSFTLSCTCNSNVSPGKAVITKSEPSGAFSGTTTLESVVTLPGTITGTLNSSDNSLTLLIESATPFGPSTFTMTSGSLEPATNEMSGTGYFEGGGTTGKPSGEFKAKRIHTYEEVLHEKEVREKAEKEAREKAAKEKEQHEKEASEKVAQEEKAKAQQEREAREKQEAKEREEKASREAAEKAAPGNPPAGSQPSPSTPTTPLTAIALESKGSLSSGAGGVAFKLANENGLPVSGQLTVIASAGKSGKSSRAGKQSVLGEASFTIPAHGTTTVKVKLSKHVRAMLAHGRKLHVEIKLSTQASGQTAILKTYSVTLSGARH